MDSEKIVTKSEFDRDMDHFEQMADQDNCISDNFLINLDLNLNSYYLYHTQMRVTEMLF